MKGLIYFVIGGNPEYSKLLKYCINTIRCYPENDKYDILVMCDESYLPNVKNLSVSHIAVTKNNISHIHASIRKVEIFEFNLIDQYDKVLFLDCDIVVCGSLDPIFDAITNPELLYVKNESTSTSDFTEYPFFKREDKPYTELLMQIFEEKKIYPFNAGQFGFCVSKVMKHHFINLKDECQKFNADIHFFEQCFMNEYFCSRFAISYDISDYCYFNESVSSFYKNRVIINHFIGFKFDLWHKLECMKNFHTDFINMYEKHMVVKIESRNKIDIIVNLPDNANVLEIGCLKGEYSQILLDKYKVKNLYLVDPWCDENVMSGDQDGNNVVIYNGYENFNYVTERFKNNSNVKIMRKFSRDISDDDIAPGSIDLIYIDGDHSYEGVKTDLNIALRLVTKNGIICGHDYCMNPEKTNENYDFGVKRAVDEFCRENGFRIWALMNDGCVSYCIRKN